MVAHLFASVFPLVDVSAPAMNPLGQLILWLICLPFAVAFGFGFELAGAVEKSEGHPQLQSNCKSNAANYCSGIIAIGMRSIVGSTDRIGGPPPSLIQ
jgi:hypothetical protein